MSLDGSKAVDEVSVKHHDLGLVFTSKGMEDRAGYSDADFGGDRCDQKSRFGCVLEIGRRAVSYIGKQEANLHCSFCGRG